jgi:hypothetical protein
VSITFTDASSTSTLVDIDENKFTERPTLCGN